MDVARRAIAEEHLRRFYGDHCPSKVGNVPAIYDAFGAQLPTLCSDLLARYPAADPRCFDPMHEALAALAHGAPPTAHGDAPPPQAAAPPDVHTVLRDGEALLAAAPVLPAPEPLDAGPTTADSGTAQGRPVEDTEEELTRLMADNERLARLVAAAEHQVLQERFKLLFADAAAADDADTAAGAPPASAAVWIKDERRCFTMAATPREWAFVLRGPVAIPVTPDAPCCTVGSDAHGEPEGRPCDANALAMAMRMWSDARPHAVGEELAATCHFHAGAELWRSWPSPVRVLPPVPAVPMHLASADPASDAADPGALYWAAFRARWDAGLAAGA